MPFEVQAAVGQAGGGHRLGPGGHGGRVLPGHRRPRGDRLRARPGPRRHAALRHPAVPPAQGRGPGGGVREPHRPGHPHGLRQGLGRDFTVDDLQNQGFDAVCVAIGCYDTNKLGVPGEDADDVLDGLEYLRIATLGLPYPGHKGKRVVVIGGGFTSMDCTRTSLRQGASEVTLVYRRDMKEMSAANEVHEAIEEGARAIFQAAPDPRPDRRQGQGHRASSSSACARRARREGPPPAGAGRGHRVHHPLRPRPAGHRPGPRPDLARPRFGRPGGLQAAAPAGRRGHLRHRPARRLRHGRRARRRHDGRPGGGRGPPRGIRHRRLPQGPRPGRDPDAPDAGRAAARVPLHRALHRRAQGTAPAPQVDGPRGAQAELHRVRDPLHAAGGDERVGPLPAVHLRGDRLLRPAPPGHRVRHDAADPRAGADRPATSAR